MNVPSQLRRFRFERGLSQHELAAATGIDASTLSRLERGLLRPRPHHTERLALFLGVVGSALFPEKERQEMDSKNYDAGRDPNLAGAKNEVSCAISKYQTA